MAAARPALNTIGMEAKRRPLSREAKRWPQHGRDGVYAFDVPHWLIGWGHTQLAVIWHEGGWRLKDTQRAALGELHTILKDLHMELCDGSKENCPAWVGYEDEGEEPGPREDHSR
ncbi:hypothetical protein [Pseudofrankia sp. DC12]|uniref:hypothetical protein n=1 Tax=Pseudofrankia sp. DC12 TaxID=683315 RepID=UPI0012FC667A|nr:hypothetical protein [Pseudofrankia sp. DC12]